MKNFLIVFFALILSNHVFADTPKERIDRYFNKAVQNGYSGSALVALDGKILLQNGYGFADHEKKIPFTAETVFDIGSITKQFTAACILMLENDGKLKVEDPITKYFENVPEDKKEITLHQLLTHSAGLVDSLGPDEEMIGREEFLAKALSSKLIHPPGSYDYSNVGFSLLAMVVEKASGEEYEHYLNKKILKPAGMLHTGYALPPWDKTKLAIGYQNGDRWGTTYDQSHYEKGVTWHLKGNGGIHSTVGDMYLWSQALQKNTVLPEKVKEKYFTPYVKEGEAESFYAYGWAISKNDRGEKIIGHNGGNGFFMATMAMIPQENFTIIVSTNRTPKNTDVVAERIQRILFEDLKALEEDFLKQYSGNYVMPWGSSVGVTFDENDQAVLALNDRSSWFTFGGSENENINAEKEFDDKTRNLFQAIFDGSVEKVISLSGLEKQEVEDFLSGFRQRLESQKGKWKSFTTLGSVGRRGGKFHLVPVILQCENGNSYRLIVWQGDRVFDFRNLPEGNKKEFEHKTGNEFYAQTNNRTIVFENENGSAVLKMDKIVAKKK